jgi:3-oxoacyl-[acyl-carrier-protein] synthase-3
MTFVRTTDRTDDLRAKAFALSPLGVPSEELSDAARWLWEELAFVWLDFEERLSAVPLIQRVENGTMTVEDYRELLLNLRQQVMEGGRWIALASSSVSVELFPIRSMMIRHAAEEHRDFQMIERNYASVGGDPVVIATQPKNIGSEALNSYMFHQASQPNPLHLAGAMFIIEGLGSAKAAGWAKNIKETLGLEDGQVTFLAYHGENDEDHYQKLRGLLSNPLVDQGLAERMAKTAKVVARLYALQLEELGNV